MNAEPCWNHDAFFSYVDRWMDPEGDDDYVNYIYTATGGECDYRGGWARHGQAWDSIVNAMWEAYGQ
jgi:hypothetical protein